MWGAPKQDEATVLRFKQIDSLKQGFPTVKEISKGSVYEVPVSLPSRKVINLRINLPPDFPRAPPSIQVFPPVQHRFIDHQMFITPQAHENLMRWNVQVNLGKVVFEIVQRFMQEPPNVLAPPSNPVIASTPPYQTNPNNNQPPPPYGQSQTHTPQPVVPSSFPQLESKTPSELTQLLNDETEFNRFFEELPVVQNMRKVRDDLRTNNEELAKKTLIKESEIDKLRKDVASSIEIIQQQRGAFEAKAQKQQEVMKRFSTANLIDKLAFAAQETEEQSDAIANRFLSGEMDYKDFIRDFMEKRKLFHLRSAKKESLMMINR
eukprot:TRINITY_DN4960_c0_g1_i1.p1 TRINITY_DN4960_c0_g1~~TRINITY_DN4960_c0_g1_i1.p1  ORF type:complete len:320 (-),score=109.69 TRINITY_DN4960_c0_g1_i1:32-991(-)